MRGSSLVLLGLLIGCGAAPEPPPAAPKPVAQAPVVAPAAQRPPQGALYREDVNALLARGFPEFLQHVDVEPRLVDGQFRGWSIVQLNPSEFWSGVDLKPGDIVTRVNDLPIERETEAFDAFESLKKSDALRVAFQRDGQSRLLEYKIISKN
ncbi:MAG TPA: serine protease [Polyangiaceae bacterium]|nr:serine protease [Polyangiaceae bacterium]